MKGGKCLILKGIRLYPLPSLKGKAQVGVNTEEPTATLHIVGAILEVISRTNDEPIFRVQNSVGKDILSIQGGGNKGGIGKLSENRGFGAYPSVLTLHNDTNRGG